MLLVDGVMKKLDSLSCINPNDVKDITILKSFEGTAIYGPDGVNGVICITMKKQVLAGNGDCSQSQTINNGVFAKWQGCRSIRSTLRDAKTYPLLVVDGCPVPMGFLSWLNPNNTESIDTLSVAAATTIYGPDGAEGAIIVVMKQTFTIRDFINGDPIPGATVTFIPASNKNTVVVAADAYGQFFMSKLSNGEICRIKVSSAGYNTVEYLLSIYPKHREKDIFLTRVVKEQQDIDKKPLMNDQQIKACPNPVSKGAALTIQWKDVEEAVAELRLVSLDGKTMLRQPVTSKGTAGQLQLSTDPRWASGIYFLQVICEKGRVLASEKIIIQ